MLIDWFTVGAQVLNFLILVWLLKRFLYHPILDAIDARERLIAGKLSAATTKEGEAARERADFEHKAAAFDAARAGLLDQASAAAAAERQRLLDAARQDAARLGARLQENLRREAQEQSQEISRQVRQEVFAIARQTLGDLAEARLEERMVAVFVDRLRALDGEQRQTLITALRATARPLLVRTCFTLAAAEQASVEVAIRTLLGSEAEIRFTTAPELVSGIELVTDGHKVAWTIDDYLSELEQRAGEWLKAKPADHDAADRAASDAR